MIEKVISGGQTGVDIAGLKAAKTVGIPTGGYMPYNCRTLDGPKPEYVQEYGIDVIPTTSYPARTLLNVQDSDFTIRIARDWQSPGERLTAKYLREERKPCFDVHLVDIDNPLVMLSLVRKILDDDYRVINIAGNSEQTCPGIEEVAYEFLLKVFKRCK